MKKITLSIICVCWLALAYSQHIHYQKTFNSALIQAAKSNKLLLLTISAPELPQYAALKSALTSPEIIKLYNKNFINYRINYTDSAAVPLIKKYKTTKYPAYLFLDSLGNLVFKDAGSSASAARYVSMNDQAVAAQISGRTLTNYIAGYQPNKNNRVFLKDYIALREELGYYDNAELAEQYAHTLSAKDFQNYQTVLFIMEAGPLAYGHAYTLCYTNKNITDSIYKYEPPALRTLINNRIITNTINNAITNKNIATAQQAIRFTAATWAKTNLKNGIIASNRRMLDYYLGIQDTASYYRQAPFFYNYYYMNISVDSAAKIDQEILRNARAATITYANTPPESTIGSAEQTNEMVKGPLAHRVSNILNNGAYSFYIMNTRNQTYLVNALLWSKRAIELYPGYHNYDTLAHILYRLGLFDEALSIQTQAVKLAIKDKAPDNEIKHFKTEQHKIKKHLL